MIEESIPFPLWQQLKEAKKLLTKAGIASASLDAEILLAHTLHESRSWLHAHSNDELSEEQVTVFKQLVARRATHVPVAYLTGIKEFYGREFRVTPDVLIPRPETEDLIELALSIISPHSSVLDLGCGSGCIGVTLKLQRPNIDVTLADISQKALNIARQNADALNADVEFVESDLMSKFIEHPRVFDYIVANLPYVNKEWETSPDTAHEPPMALFADDAGLALIYTLIDQSKTTLRSGGSLVLEADPEQHSDMVQYAEQYGLSHQATKGYSLSFEKQS